MKQVIYCKYNLNRAPEFQTKTVIYQDGEERYIEKYALTEKAQSHMERFENNYAMTKDLYPAIQFISLKRIGKGICYPYIDGKTMDEVLGEKIRGWDDVQPEFKKMIDEIYVVNEKYRQEFVMTEGFRELFGDVDCSGDVCVCPCNLDVIFDNLMLVDGKIVAFDYEWVYNFPIPQKYVIYRILCRFYDKYLHYLERHFTFDEFVSAFEFSEEEKVRYRKMEDAYIRHVYADGDAIYQNQAYKRHRTSYLQMKDMEKQNVRLEEERVRAIEEYNKAMEVLHSTEKEYLLTIERLNEAAKLKMEADMMIHQANAFIRDKIEEINELHERIEILGGNSKVSRIWVRGVRGIRRSGVKRTAINATRKVFRKIFGRTGGLRESERQAQSNALRNLIEVSAEEQEAQKKTKFDKEHKVSIITPLFNTPEKYLVELLESVKNQTYANWEFCLVNFSTTDFERVNKTCQQYAKEDERISYYVADENKGISENTNTCISYATGDYIGLLDHDDILHPCALYEVMKVINEIDADFVYTDEVKFSEGIDDVFLPNFKPDFSRDELRAHNYICHFNVYKTGLYHEVGGYRQEFDGSQDHDIVLRLTEKAQKIVHIPKILYYWRVHPNSVAQSIDAKSYATDAGEAAVTEQLKRMNEKQYAESVINRIPLYRIRTELEEQPDVTVVIWNAENEDAVKRTEDSLGELQECKRIVLHADETYDSVMSEVDTKYALFVCAGLQLQSDSLAKEIMIYARRNDIATIDCKVFTENDIIYSGGACLSGDSGMPVKLRCMGGPRDYSGYENGMFHSRNVTASTGLCTFVDVDIWKQSEGFGDTNSMCWMIDYSYKMWKAGKNNLWTPFVEVVGMDNDLQQQYIEGLCGLRDKEFDKRDAYVSEYVSKLHLE